MNFRMRYKPDPVGFQVIPMIDILFLLLCFFVTSQVYSLWETELNVQLPTAQVKDIPTRLEGEIIINVLKDGTIVINKQVLDRARLASVLERVAKLFPGQAVLIRGDSQTPYEHIIKVLDLCRAADISNVSFATALSEEKTPR